MTSTKPPHTKKVYHIDDIACKFGNLSIGPEKCTISCSVERSDISIEEVEPIIVGSRLDVRLTFDPAGRKDVAGQASMVNTTEHLESVADCPSLSVKPSKLGFRLAFAAGSMDVKVLAQIAQATGTVSLTRIGEAGAEAAKNDDGEDEAND